MKKVFVLIAVILAGLLAGCSVLERFQQAEEQYLETRVADLVEEMTTVEPAVEEPAAEEPKDAEPAVEETAEVTPEATVEVTEEAAEATAEEPVVEETPEPTEEAQPEPVVESEDPAIYLGDPDWVDEMDKPEFWDVSASEYDLAAFNNGALSLKALHDEPGWRIASTGSLSKVFIEAEFNSGSCSGSDSYGLVFRIQQNGSAYNQGYFFGVTCDGRYSLRSWDGEDKVSKMVKTLTASNLINTGKEKVNRLGVMTYEDRILLFINGELADDVMDETFGPGYFGVFVNRDATKDLTVYVNRARYWLDPEPK